MAGQSDLKAVLESFPPSGGLAGRFCDCYGQQVPGLQDQAPTLMSGSHMSVHLRGLGSAPHHFHSVVISHRLSDTGFPGFQEKTWKVQGLNPSLVVAQSHLLLILLTTGRHE